MTVNPREHRLIRHRHPRFVTPMGDQRDNAVPCDSCRNDTLALNPTRCLACEPVADVGFLELPGLATP